MMDIDYFKTAISSQGFSFYGTFQVLKMVFKIREESILKLVETRDKFGPISTAFGKII